MGAKSNVTPMYCQKLGIICFGMLIAAILICGCTGTSTTISTAQQEVSTTSIPTTTPSPVITTHTIAPTTIPTTVPTTKSPAQYSAGEVVSNADGTSLQVITQVDENLGKYCVRSAFDSDGELVLKKDDSSKQMGNWYSIRDIDAQSLKSLGIAKSIPIWDTDENFVGYLEYQNARTMKFVEASPDNLKGDVKFVLDIYYSGNVRVYSSLGGVTTTKTYSVSEYSEIDLGKSDHAFVSVSKEDSQSGTLRAVLKAAGVVVAEGDVSDKYGSATLSYYTN